MTISQQGRGSEKIYNDWVFVDGVGETLLLSGTVVVDPIYRDSRKLKMQRHAGTWRWAHAQLVLKKSKVALT